MYKFLICLIIFMSVLPIYAQTITTRRPYYHQNNYNRYYNPYHHKNYILPKDNLSALEKYALKKSYSRESDISRLERLEDLTFGSIQSGDIMSRYKNVENAILSRPSSNYNKQSFLNNLSNYFSGQMTGYTPSLDSWFDKSYSPSYSASRIDQYTNGIFGNGFRVMNSNYGTGSGVKILD